MSLITALEDLHVAARATGRPKDRIDLAGLAALPGLDWTYVERHARDWELEARLHSLREEPESLFANTGVVTG